MKSAPSAVISALANSRELTFADCFTITLADSTVARYTNAQYTVIIPVSSGPALVYVAGDILIDGLKLKQTCGIDIDEQSIDISFKPTSIIAGLSWPIAVREGRFDGATIERARAVLTAPGGTVIGGAAVVSFHGLVATVDNIGRLSCKMTVKSMLNKLAVDMPRDIWQPNCLNTLYDGLCTMVKSANGASGTVGTSPTLTFIPWSGSAADTYDQGTITFESGANVGVSRTVRLSTTSGLTQSVLDHKADYLIALKGNQVNLLQEVEAFFGHACLLFDSCVDHNKGHGRIEQRSIRVTTDVARLKTEKLPHIASVACVDRRIEKSSAVSHERQFYISSRALSAKAFLEAVRLHWQIENAQHWVLDVTFKDDLARVRKGFGAKNMAVVRHFALNLVRNTTDKKSLKLRRKVASWDTDYLYSLLVNPDS